MAGRINHDFTKYADKGSQPINVQRNPIPEATICFTYRYADTGSNRLSHLRITPDTPDFANVVQALFAHFRTCTDYLQVSCDYPDQQH